MTDITIEMLPALSGDCFLIKLGKYKRTNIIIDSGYSETYDNYLKYRLNEIKSLGEIVNLMVITHIDADHISGAIKFIKENNDDLKFNEGIVINEIWHNSLRHVYLEEREEEIISENDNEILEMLQIKGMPIPEDSYKRINKPISGLQGSVLGGLIKLGNYNWNKNANGKAICIENLSEKFIINDVKINLLTPNYERLKQLKNSWEKNLRKNKGFRGRITNDQIFDDVYEILLGESFDIELRRSNSLISGSEDLSKYALTNEIIDESVVNASSISFIMEYNNKKVLFLGDANPEDVFDAIKSLYDWSGKEKIIFNAIKISHHGSRGNTTKKLLSMIDSEKFIISTNGNLKHNHPHIETIAKIVCRDSEFTRELIFNYKNVGKKFENKEWMKKYNYKIRYINEDGIQKIEI